MPSEVLSTSSPSRWISDISYRSQLDSTVDVVAFKIGPKRITGSVMQALRGKLFSQRGVRPCVDTLTALKGSEELDALAEVGDFKFFILRQDLTAQEIDLLEEEVRQKASSCAESAKLIFTFARTAARVHLTYKNYTMTEILNRVLPEGVSRLSGFEQVGHIAHVNLDDEHLPFKRTIGQVILDCNDRCVRTVVNKVGVINSVYRAFQMECLAGDPDAMTASVSEYGCVFQVPYDKVYWNSRLSFEHDRLVKKLLPGDELFDVMAGVGPFAIPAARCGVHVHANDLNPDAVLAMRENARLNSVEMDIYEMDGREFIDSIVRKNHLCKSVSPAAGKSNAMGSRAPRRHLVMNLPALAVQFLDTFTRPSFKDGSVLDRTMLIHVYAFSYAEDPLADGVKQVEGVLGVQLGNNLDSVVLVRNVAPKKEMVCISFTIPEELLTEDKNGNDEPENKKLRVEKIENLVET